MNKIQNTKFPNNDDRRYSGNQNRTQQNKASTGYQNRPVNNNFDNNDYNAGFVSQNTKVKNDTFSYNMNQPESRLGNKNFNAKPSRNEPKRSTVVVS